MLPVLVIIADITALAVLAFRWFERYRYTDGWRTSEFRVVAFGFLMWFGGIFGHRFPPPPKAKMKLTTRAGEPEPPGSGGPALPDEAADAQQQAGGVSRQPPHQVRIPLGSVGHVDPNAIAFPQEPVLQIAADAVEHLELETVRGNLALTGKVLSRLDQPIVVGGNRGIDAMQQQLLHLGLEFRIDLGLLRERDVGRLVVGALDQPHPDLRRIHAGDVVPRAIEVALQHDTAVGIALVQCQHQVERALRVGGAFHVDKYEVVELASPLEDP